MLLRFSVLTLLALANCARPVTRSELPAPNPNGCYAIVYDRPLFAGARDLLNGPAQLAGLDQLPNTIAPTWRSRIRSLRVGPRATVKAYDERAFTGHSQQFAAGSEHPRLEEPLSARIQSLEMACVDGPGPRP